MSPSDRPDTDRKFSNINLRVTEAERWDFKAWCAEHRMSQVDAFREAFALLREKHGTPVSGMAPSSDDGGHEGS